MLNIDYFRRIDPSLKDVDDAELEEARDALYDVAQLAFEVWHYRKFGSKNPVGLLTSGEEQDTI